MTERHRLRRIVAGAGLLALATSLLTVAPAQAAPGGCANRSNNSVEKLLECVQGANVAQRLAALQAIADANGGTRASGTPGYAASVAYVVGEARKAGLTVATQDFEFPFFELNGASFAQVAPTQATYALDVDFTPMTYSGAGDVTGTAVPVDLVLPPTPVPSSTSGCEAADFAGFPAGSVALIQRGTCTFGEKAQNAAAAGATAVIIFNEGQPGRDDLLQGTLGAPVAIPVIGVGFALGQSLQNATVRVAVDAISEIRTTTNVTAEITGSRTPDQVLMVGSHLDSVTAGPGINDNGSGSATNLEVATLMAKSKPASTVRFAWWGAEELGLLGSINYVTTLPAAELARITGYLNFDMLASPNFARFVYDGDDSDAVGAGPGPEGSAAIEKVFEAFYTSRGLAFEGTDFDGRSDYGPFIDAGIPAGGLFSGAEGIKTPEQAARYGGTAGVAYDSCYHQACDTKANINATALDQNADAVAYATLTLAGTHKKSGKTPKVATTQRVAGPGAAS